MGILAGKRILVTGVITDASIVVSDRTLQRMGANLNEVSMGLVTVAPGADIASVKEALRARLPPDCVVWTRRELEETEQVAGRTPLARLPRLELSLDPPIRWGEG